MVDYIALSKMVTEKSVKPGGGEFRKKFWDNFSEKRLYNLRKNNLLSKKQDIQDKRFFKAKIEYENNGNNIANSNMPSKIFEHTKLSITKKKNNEIVVNGDRDSINDFFNIIQSASFFKAKQPSSSKNTTLSREVYCFEDIAPIVAEDIIIGDLLTGDLNDNLDLLVELYPEFKYAKGQSIINKIEEFIKNGEKGDILGILGLGSEIIQNTCIRIRILRRYINDLISEIPEIQCISETPEIVIQRSIESSISVNFSRKVENSNIIVGVFDQGIGNVFSSSIFQKEKLVDDQQTDHGTKVASKILFGRLLNRSCIPTSGSIDLIPYCKLLDIKVIDGNNQIQDFFGFCKELNDIVIKYPNVHLYNLSLGLSKKGDLDLKTINTCTAIIDRLAKLYDKIFVISAGNTEAYKILSKQANETYIDCVNKLHPSATEVLSPGDSVNGITVGSIVESFNHNSIAKTIGEISPFSRIGINRNGIFLRKPDLVEFGGNVIYFDSNGTASDETLKSFVITNDGLIKGDIGTSFSAPIITNLCAHILNFFENSQIKDSLEGNRLNLVKGLLIHKTSVKNNNTLGRDENLFYGYGQPGDIDSIIGDPINSFSFLHIDKLYLRQGREGSTEKTHILTVDLPGIPNRTEFKVIITLSYTPPVNKNFVTEYTQINMKPSVKVNGIPVRKNKFLYKYNEENSPVKSLCFKQSKRNSDSNRIDIKIQSTILQDYLKKLSGSEYHSYSIFVTLIDESGNMNIRERMIATNYFEIIHPVEVPIEIQEN